MSWALLLASCVADGGFGGPVNPIDPVSAATDTGDTGDTGDSGVPGEPLRVVDVVIVGGGPAGLAALIDVQQGGGEGLLIERTDTLGGAARYSGALCLFSGTQDQLDHGYEDSPALLLEEWPEITGGDPTDPWVMTYAERNVPDVYQWLIDMGEHFLLDTSGVEDVSGPRIHAASGLGDGLIEALADHVDTAGVALGVEASDLVLDDDGRVIGVELAGPLSEDDPPAGGWVQAGAVVVATGGFLRDLDLVSWARPELDTDQLWFSTGPESDGNGQRLLERHGATWQNPGAIGIYAHGVQDSRAEREELALLPRELMVMVNADGQRFTSEPASNDLGSAQQLIDQPGQLAWGVFDAVGFGTLSLQDPMKLDDEGDVPTLDELVAAGLVHQADDVDTLASDIGVPAAALQDTLDAFNGHVRDETKDPYWGTVPDVPPIDAPPLYAVRIVPALAKGFGGIDVDLSGRVVDGAGQPIPGLYAAGELTGMAGGSLVGDVGFTGSLSAVMLSGRIAGQAAVDEALR